MVAAVVMVMVVVVAAVVVGSAWRSSRPSPRNMGVNEASEVSRITVTGPKSLKNSRTDLLNSRERRVSLALSEAMHVKAARLSARNGAVLSGPATANPFASDFRASTQKFRA